MGRRGDGIRKRGDGRWEGRYAIGRKEDGSKLYASVYARSYSSVKEKLAERKKDPPKPASVQAKPTVFEAVAVQWLQANTIRLKPSTQSKYAHLLETQILPQLGPVPVQDLSSVTINAFLKGKMEKGRVANAGGLSAAYTTGIRTLILSILRFAQEQGLCQPLKGQVYRPKASKKEIAVLKKADQQALEEYLNRNQSSAGLGMLLSLYMGLRIGEVCALRWCDLDLSLAVVHIRHTVSRVRKEDQSGSVLILDTPKTPSSFREIPIPAVLLPLLQRQYEHKQSAYVISDHEGFVPPRTLEFRFQACLKNAGLPHINYHALRHTFATRCIEAGVDVKSLSELLGHANAAITLNTYVHSSMEIKKQQIEKLAALLSQG